MVIRKKGGKWCLYSKKSGRNLGCSRTKAGARKREREVQYFKSHPRRREVHVRDHRRRASERPHASEFARRDPYDPPEPRKHHRPMQMMCPIKSERSEASGGDLNVGFYIYSHHGGPPIPIPDFARDKILRAETPRGIELAIEQEESYIAHQDEGREFLDCDEAANLMSAALRVKGIPHLMVVGTSDEGSSHAYIVIGRKRYDPTHQGYGNGKIEQATRWP